MREPVDLTALGEPKEVSSFERWLTDLEELRSVAVEGFLSMAKEGSVTARPDLMCLLPRDELREWVREWGLELEGELEMTLLGISWEMELEVYK